MSVINDESLSLKLLVILSRAVQSTLNVLKGYKNLWT
ncbi:hypothetical protein BACERE00185_04937 [Bacillus mobilis]|uniref:Uncharacterized protein n=1 Tax=Bacillus mobilis TaxID=2026190 RepID=A0A1Y6AQ21_9BACI|nr:hypothetical protein BACERE00185_04937 [Bacillus mobilis]